ncbi:MAG TPA: type II secretion system inner membrane protein GspF [Polyangia bacterium]
MPLYAWKGLDARGKTTSGTREADGVKSLRQILRKDAVFLTETREVVGGKRAATTATGASAASGLKREIDFSRLFERVSQQEVAIFTRQLATLLRAGIPLAEALAALAEQADNRKFQLILAGIRQKVNEGGALADALGEHPRVFVELYTNMVRSGEAAGNLDAVLERLAEFLDEQLALKSKVSSALTYPIVMAVVGSLIITVLMVVVVPQIATVFEDAGGTLPWNTQLLIFMAGTIGSYWWVIVPLLVAGFFVFRTWARTPRGRLYLDRIGLKVWVLGPLLRHIAVARFSRTLATMLASGVPLLTALEIVRKVLDNRVLEKVVEAARDTIREGESIATTLKKSGEFPSMMCHMVAVGERSGQLESMLENVAVAYERDVSVKVGRLTALLSPLMIVLMAVAVGFLVFSILGPIMDMQQLVQ